MVCVCILYKTPPALLRDTHSTEGRGLCAGMWLDRATGPAQGPAQGPAALLGRELGGLAGAAESPVAHARGARGGPGTAQGSGAVLGSRCIPLAATGAEQPCQELSWVGVSPPEGSWL